MPMLVPPNERAAAPLPVPGFPAGPLAATMAMQTIATMAAFSVPALAPEIARDLDADGALAGYFVSLVYGTGIVSSLFAAGLIHRYGAVRMSQCVLAATVAMLLICASSGLRALAAGAVMLGTMYGATAPVSAHLLVPRTPPAILNLVLSIRQIGVPLGGVLAALLLPPLALHLGWRLSLLFLIIPAVAVLLLLEVPRRAWDRGAGAAPLARAGSVRQAAHLLAGSGELRRLTLASFIYSGLQLTFVAFITVQLTSRAQFGLVAAGQALALYQIAGVLCRPLWGWIADRWMTARALLVWHGLLMGAAAAAAAHFSAEWPHSMVLLVYLFAGLTANGYTGLAYAEFARLGGAQRTEATGLGSAAMFSGVLVLPSLAATVVTLTGSYVLAFTGFGIATALAAVVLARGGRHAAASRQR